MKKNQSEYEEQNIYTDVLSASNFNGGAIRDIAMGLMMLSRELSSYFKIKVIVLDTNIILRELGHICSKKKTTTLFSEAEIGFIRLLTSRSVFDEVTEKIPEFAFKRKISSEHLFIASFVQYVELIKPNGINIHPQSDTTPTGRYWPKNQGGCFK